MVRVIKDKGAVRLGFSSDLERSEIISELRKIKSNEKGKLISCDLIEFDNSSERETRSKIIFDACPALESFKNINPREIVLVGARNLGKNEIENISRLGIRNVSLSALVNNIEEVSDLIMESSAGLRLHIVFNMNSIDPAFAPSVKLPEMGGLTPRQAIYLVSRMSLMKNLEIFELTGFDLGSKDNTLKIVAKLLAELL